MNQLNTKLKKFCLQLHRNDNASPPITVAESTSIQTLTLMVTKIFEGRPAWENNKDMFLSLSTPTGKRAESHAKNKLTGYTDLLKILSLQLFHHNENVRELAYATAHKLASELKG